MATDSDAERLLVLVEAKINDFEKNMKKASATANSEWSKVEARSKAAANRLQADMGKVAANVADSVKGIGLGIASGLGVGTIGLTGFLALAVKINSELAKLEGLARRAGISTDELQKNKFAFNVKGGSDEDFSASISTSL